MEHSQGFLKLVTETQSRIQEVDIEYVQTRENQNKLFYIVDVREDSEWANGHLQHAIHIGKGVIERDIEQRIPDQSAEIILYCGGGYRSVLAADSLQKMGYTRVASMKGGFRAWTQRGYPIVKV